MSYNTRGAFNGLWESASSVWMFICTLPLGHVTSTNVSFCSPGEKHDLTRRSLNVPYRFKGWTSPLCPRQTESVLIRRHHIRSGSIPKQQKSPHQDLFWTHNALQQRHVEPTRFQSRSTPAETCNPGSYGASLHDRSALNQTATRWVNTARLGAFKELWKLSLLPPTSRRRRPLMFTHILVGADGSQQALH